MLHVLSSRIGAAEITGRLMNPSAWHWLLTPTLLLADGYSLGDDLIRFENYLGPIYPTPPEGEESLYGSKPRYIIKPDNDLARYLAWSQFVSNTAEMFSGSWDFRSGTLVNDSADHSMQHKNLQGMVGGRFDGSSRWRTPNQNGVYTGERVTKTDSWHFDTETGEMSFSLSSGVFGSNEAPHGDLLSRLQYIDEIGIESFSGDRNGVEHLYSNLSYDVQGRGVSWVCFDEIRRAWGFPNHYHACLSQVRFDYSLVRTGNALIENGSVLSLYDIQLNIRVRTTYVTQEWSYPEVSAPPVTIDQWNQTPYYTYTLTKALGSIQSELNGVKELVYGEGPHSFANFCWHTSMIMADVYPVMSLAAMKAVEDTEDALTNNHIEALAELGDIVDLIDLAEVVVALKKLGKLSMKRTLFSLLSALADVKLTYSLALGPTTDDLTQIAERAGRLHKRLSQGVKRMSGKGVVVEVPDGLIRDFDGCKVVAKSVLDVDIEWDSLLFSVLGAESLGLLPRTASLWDLVPWSFVVDAFTGLGNTGDLFDKQLMLLAIRPTRSCNLVRVFYDFSVEDELEYSFETLSMFGDPPRKSAGYRYVERIVIDMMPPLAPTRLPIVRSGAGFNWQLHGALLWKSIS